MGILQVVPWLAAIYVYWTEFTPSQLNELVDLNEIANMNTSGGFYPDTQTPRATFLPEHLSFYDNQELDLDYYKPAAPKRTRHPSKIAEWNLAAGVGGPFTKVEEYHERIANYVNSIEWNGYYRGVNRKSFHFDKLLLHWTIAPHLGYREVYVPLNVIGRTGVKGIPLTDQYGPNHCMDIVISRIKKVVQVLVIKRGDSGEIAFPGGKIDPYEVPLHAAYRELWEETKAFIRIGQRILHYLGFSEHNGLKFAITYFRGCSGDNRDTDESWFETTAVGSHGSDREKDPQYYIKFADEEELTESERQFVKSSDGCTTDECRKLREECIGENQTNGKPRKEPTDTQKLDEKLRIMEVMGLKKESEKKKEVKKAFWMTVHRNIAMSAGHRLIAKRVARTHDCYY